MDKKIEGSFSLGLCSLQLQLEHLLEGSGGEKAARLLDLLADLSESERTIMLDHFTAAIEQITKGETRLSTDEDQAREEFGESLLQDIVSSFERERNIFRQKPRKLAVVEGGKGKMPARENSLIDFCEARSRRTQQGIN